MKTKAILFDVDGVVLLPRDKYFSQRLKEYSNDIDSEKVGQFFKGVYKQIILGKADLKEELSGVMADWGWQGTVDELLHFWFSYENKLNQEIIDFVVELRQKGVMCYLTSGHSDYRKQDLLNTFGLSKYFDGAFFSSDVGYTKEEKEYYVKVLVRIGLVPDEVLFVDDDMKNVEVAKTILPNAFVFTTLENLRKIGSTQWMQFEAEDSKYEEPYSL